MTYQEAKEKEKELHTNGYEDIGIYFQSMEMNLLAESDHVSTSLDVGMEKVSYGHPMEPFDTTTGAVTTTTWYYYYTTYHHH
jgi:hypothetical protein